MNIVFRVDASPIIGLGHAMRCLTLAEALAEKNCRIFFLSQQMPSFLIQSIREKHFHFVQIPEDQKTCTPELHDAESCLPYLRQIACDLLIVDHYQRGYIWERRLIDTVGRIMVIDDFLNRRHCCQVFLNQSVRPEMGKNLSAFYSKTLIGPHYALLRPEFAHLRELTEMRNQGVREIFVFLGGGETSHWLNKLFPFLTQAKYKDLTFHIVFSQLTAQHIDIEKWSAFTQFSIHVQTPLIAKLMSQADLAIGAAGSASWERCCLKLPSLVFSLAENQVDIANYLSDAEAAEYIESTSMSDCAERLDFYIKNPDILSCLSRQAAALVDGQGARRVVGALLS